MKIKETKTHYKVPGFNVFTNKIQYSNYPKKTWTLENILDIMVTDRLRFSMALGVYGKRLIDIDKAISGFENDLLVTVKQINKQEKQRNR